MRKYILAATCSVGLVIATPISAWATQNPTIGQPGAPLTHADQTTQ